MLTLNCKGKILSLERPLIMGILNATPDSFFEGHLNDSNDSIIKRVGHMIADGADIIDIGGQSTKPGSERVELEEEKKRVIPVIDLIHQHYPECIISVDTYYSKVAELAVHVGASIVNDISAGNFDKDMIEIVGKLKVPYICMHMQGTPETMQNNPQYQNITKEVIDFFSEKIQECKKANIQDIIIDPGFGFGKTIEHNFKLLREMEALKILKLPILAGLSRKGMIYKSLNTSANEALNGTSILNTLALNNGASILRVHDVKEAREAVALFQLYKNATL
jgi:dihydropteroate synthase